VTRFDVRGGGVFEVGRDAGVRQVLLIDEGRGR
jgi:hypothetical protein